MNDFSSISCHFLFPRRGCWAARWLASLLPSENLAVLDQYPLRVFGPVTVGSALCLRECLRACLGVPASMGRYFTMKDGTTPISNHKHVNNQKEEDTFLVSIVEEIEDERWWEPNAERRTHWVGPIQL